MTEVRLDLTEGRSYTITLARQIDDGGQGRVYEITELPGFCAKIYRQPETQVGLEERLSLLSQFGNGSWHVGDHPELAFPVGLCRDDDGQCIGFAMHQLTGPRVPLLKVLRPAAPIRRNGLLTWEHCVHFAADLARVVGKLHEVGVVVGDLCLDNVFVSLADGRITLVDVDSFQLLGPAGLLHPTWVLRPDYSAPELARQPPGTWRSRASDLTPLGIVVAQILLDQVHPFAGHPVNDDLDLGDGLDAHCIAAGLSWITSPDEVDPPKDAPDAARILPPAIIGLMRRCFSAGATDPQQRPAASDWVHDLAKLANGLQTCETNARHRFRSGPSLCPWCERAKVIGRDPFPAPRLRTPDLEPWLAQTDGAPDQKEAWRRIEQLKEQGAAVNGTVVEAVKGGLVLDLGVPAFLPASQVELHRSNDLKTYVGRQLEVKIIDMDSSHDNVVVSRRALLEDKKAEALAGLQPDQIRKGVVSSIVNFGVFVDLGDASGLVHKSELAWHHFDHPSEVVRVGQELEVRVLEVDRQRKRVSLSLKATQEHPWLTFARTHPIGEIVAGTVTKLVQFGAFVRVTVGIEGLVHISELAERHLDHPDRVVKVGQKVLVKIINVDTERRRLSLSIKKADADFVSDEALFEPTLYGMIATYDDDGNYVYPVGFDPTTDEWLIGYEKEREAWERDYARARELWLAHAKQARASRSSAVPFAGGNPVPQRSQRDNSRPGQQGRR